MCLAPRIALPAAPAPPPTALDRGVLTARDAQRRRQRQAGGYNGTLLSGAAGTLPAAPMKSLLGG